MVGVRKHGKKVCSVILVQYISKEKTCFCCRWTKTVPIRLYLHTVCKQSFQPLLICFLESTYGPPCEKIRLYCMWITNTHYYNTNLIWRTVSCRVDEVIPSNHPRREASRVIQWYGLIHETWYSTPDQVTIIIICLLYTFFWHYSDFITCFGL